MKTKLLCLLSFSFVMVYSKAQIKVATNSYIGLGIGVTVPTLPIDIRGTTQITITGTQGIKFIHIMDLCQL